MLNAYLAQVESLLDDFGNVEYTQANLTTYINDARVQIAGASESIRLVGTSNVAANTQVIIFSSVGVPSGVEGVQGVLDIRMVTLVGGNQLAMEPWEWFFSYGIAAPSSGTPTMCSVLQPGIGGSIYFWPTPSGNAGVVLDAVWYPVALTADATPEALQYPWTEAVQYYAAYLALLNAQRRTDADAMFARYSTFETRATQMTTPTRLPRNYPGNQGAELAGQNMPITAQRR